MHLYKMILQNSLTIILVQSGIMVSIPILLIGYLCEQKYGFNAAITGVTLANILIAFISFLAMPYIVKTRMTTPEHFGKIFGPFGSKLNAIASIVSLIGWFAINLNLMQESVSAIKFNIYGANIFLPIFLGLATIFVVIKGIKRIALINYFLVPILFTFISVIFLRYVKNVPAIQFVFNQNTFEVFLFIFFANVVIFYHAPSYFRFAKNIFHARLSAFINFAILLSLVQIMGIFLAYSTHGQIGLFDFLLKDFNLFAQIIFAVILIFSSFIINNNNLYGLYLNTKFLSPSSSEVKLIFALGLLGTALSYFNLLSRLEIVLRYINFLIVINTSIFFLYIMRTLKRT